MSPSMAEAEPYQADYVAALEQRFLEHVTLMSALSRSWLGGITVTVRDSDSATAADALAEFRRAHASSRHARQ